MLVYRVKLNDKTFSLGGLKGEREPHKGKLFMSISMAQRHITNVYNDSREIYDKYFYHSRHKGCIIVVDQLKTVAEERYVPKPRGVKNE
jgi:hypothetical protein